MAKNPWEDDPVEFWADDPIEEETPKKKGKAPAEVVMEGLRPGVASDLANLRGLGEAGLGLLTGALGSVVGGISGTIAGIREHGVGTTEKQKKVEAEAAKQGASLTFEPKTERGQEISGKVGEFINQNVIPLGGHMGLLEGAATARGIANAAKAAAKPPVKPSAKAMAELPPLTLDEAIAQAEKAPENQRMGPPTRSSMPWEADTIVEPAKGQPKNLRQGELDFGEQPQQITVSPQGTAMVSPEQVAGYEQFGRRMETPEAPPQAPLRGQGDLFMNEEVTGPIASPINAAERGALPEPVANPALLRRQMELQLADEGTLFADEGGTITRDLPEQGRVITETPEQIAFAQAEAERRMRADQTKAAIEQGETGNLFPDYMNKHRDYELFRDESGRPLSRGDFNKTVDNLAKEPSTGYIRPEDMDAAYAKYLENFGGTQAGLFDQPTQAKAMEATLKADAAERMADNHPLVKAAERHLSQEQQFLDQLKQQGASLEAIKQAAEDVKAAAERMDTTRANVLKAIQTTGSAKGVAALRKKAPTKAKGAGKETMLYEGIGETSRRIGRYGRYGRQSGGVTTDFLTGILSLGLDKKIGSLAKKTVDITPNEAKTKYLPQGIGLEDYTKERRSAAEVAAEIKEKNIPDAPASMLDSVQAGGLYKQLETNNPIIRKTFAAVSEAYNRAHTNIRNAIQDPDVGLPALFRKMTKQEAGDWWAARQVAEGEMNLTRVQMEEMGWSEKQIQMNKRFDEITNYVFDKINQARAIAGKAPIDKRIGYLAGQASGDFRRLVYKLDEQGNKQVIGILGSDIRKVLDRRVAALLKEHPEWKVDHEIQANRGKRENRQKAFEDAVEMLAENNPDTKALIDAYDNILKSDAYNYMNAKKHTMQKKGVFGTEGFKRDVDAWTNAKEGMASQIRYIEKMFNWVEMSKAVDEVKPLLTDDSINMPNAKRWSSDYIDRALGIQNSEIGAAIDGVISAVGNKMGVGHSAIDRGLGATKNVVSKYLLGYGNPLFLAINLVQPAVASPAIRSLLKGRGLDISSGTITRGAMDFALMQAHEKFGVGKLDSVTKEIYNEGKKRNIFGSEIFEHSPHLTKGRYRMNKIAEAGISTVEGVTRGTVFTAMSKLLHENGYRGTKLFDIAENLTNQIMTDYRNFEAPAVYKNMGSIGEMAVTLQRYKHNSLSNLAMLAREAKRNKNYRPLVTAITAGIATSGLSGMLGFNEADFLYQKATQMMGKPDTLTRLLLDSGAPDALTYGGISALTGLDMSKRFGMALFPDNPAGALFPGISRLGEIAASGLDLAKDPTDATNAQRFARDIVPNTFRGAMDRAFFETPEGLAINPRTLEGTVERDETDKFAKGIGGVGLNESKTKSRLYQESLVDKKIAERRQSVTNKILNDLYQIDPKDKEAIRAYFNEGDGVQLKQDFIDAEGSIDNLVSAVDKFRKGGVTTALQRKMLQVAAAKKEGDLKKAKRYKQMKESLDQ